jgi:16S rRNA (cytosine1402-N4)-methyltransferase
MEFVHRSVLASEVMANLPLPTEGGLLIDCTLGEGGHSALFLERYPNLQVIGIDRDATILSKAVKRLEKYGSRFTPVNMWFDHYLASYEGERVDALLFDLGISTFHYAQSLRGFSFAVDEELDMRLNLDGDLTAGEIVNTYTEKEIADLIYKYGEERYSRRIASAICRSREEEEIVLATSLADIIARAVPPQYRYGRLHPATRTFQALRIAVNGEIERIVPALERAIQICRPGGHIGVISFHSLEDRPVKHFFRERAALGEVNLVTKKPIVPTEEESSENPPSRSAKFRVVERRGE